MVRCPVILARAKSENPDRPSVPTYTLSGLYVPVDDPGRMDVHKRFEASLCHGHNPASDWVT